MQSIMIDREPARTDGPATLIRPDIAAYADDVAGAEMIIRNNDW